jgi:hypothetical protein
VGVATNRRSGIFSAGGAENFLKGRFKKTAGKKMSGWLGSQPFGAVAFSRQGQERVIERGQESVKVDSEKTAGKKMESAPGFHSGQLTMARTRRANRAKTEQRKMGTESASRELSKGKEKGPGEPSFVSLFYIPNYII